jgi:hypothetical protein
MASTPGPRIQGFAGRRWAGHFTCLPSPSRTNSVGMVWNEDLGHFDGPPCSDIFVGERGRLGVGDDRRQPALRGLVEEGEGAVTRSHCPSTGTIAPTVPLPTMAFLHLRRAAAQLPSIDAGAQVGRPAVESRRSRSKSRIARSSRGGGAPLTARTLARPWNSIGAGWSRGSSWGVKSPSARSSRPPTRTIAASDAAAHATRPPQATRRANRLNRPLLTPRV